MKHNDTPPPKMPIIQKANDLLASIKSFTEPAPLFDEFWRDGELALLFGAAGTGKSILAVEVADALARGTPLNGFRMPTRRHKVLYVDLDLSDRQFMSRYSHRKPPKGKRASCRFGENFYRCRPGSSDDIAGWLRTAIVEEDFRVVVIDALSAIRKTADGTRETLPFMRELRRITHELGVSILVVADSAQPGKSGLVAEADLRRSRILCSAADSVFAVGVHPHFPDQRYVVQTRSRHAPIVWTEANAPTAWITRRPSGRLAFEFDERFREQIDETRRGLICTVKRLIEAKRTHRQIAAELAISRSAVGRLLKQWTPAMAAAEDLADASSGVEGVDDQPEPEQAATALDPDSTSPVDLADNEDPSAAAVAGSATDGSDDTARTRRVSVFDLDERIDGYGRQIYVESIRSNGEPKVWYLLKHDVIVKFEFRGSHINAKRLGPPPWLPARDHEEPDAQTQLAPSSHA